MIRLLILMSIVTSCYTVEFFKEGTQTWFVRYQSMIDMSATTNNTEGVDIVTIGFHDYVYDNVALGMEFNKYSFVTVPNKKSIDGLGSAITLRFTQSLNDWYLHGNIDLGVGVLATEDPFPESGTEVNFTEFLGTSLSYVFTENLYSEIGIRYTHISNGGFEHGSSRNPGADFVSSFFSIGYIY